MGNSDYRCTQPLAAKNLKTKKIKLSNPQFLMWRPTPSNRNDATSTAIPNPQISYFLFAKLSMTSEISCSARRESRFLKPIFLK